MPVMTVRDASISYREVGEGLHVVVLIHGNHQSSQIWSPILAKIPEEFRALAFDLRGFGSSEKRADGADVHGQADDIRQALHKLGVVRCSVMASAAGCGVAISLAARYPSLIYKLVMSGPFCFHEGRRPPKRDNEDKLNAEVERTELELKDDIWHSAKTAEESSGAEWSPEELLPILMEDLASEPDPEQKDALISIAMNCHREACQTWSRSMEWPILSQLLREITAKTRVIKGPADDLLDRYSNMLEVMIANCETVEISKPILCPVLECPDDYLQSGLELLNAW